MGTGMKQNRKRYQYHTGIGSETADTRHEAVGQVAIYLRDDLFTNPYFAASCVQAVTPDDPVHDGHTPPR